MSWIKKLFQKFKNEDDEFEYNQNEIEDSTGRLQQSGMGKDVDARVLYQYPKGQFRFPLIPDEAETLSKGARSRIRRQENQFPPQEPVKRKEQKEGSRRSFTEGNQPANTKIKRSPFRPSETPSPIYGFDRPKMKDRAKGGEMQFAAALKTEEQPIIYELNSDVEPLPETFFPVQNGVVSADFSATSFSSSEEKPPVTALTSEKETFAETPISLAETVEMSQEDCITADKVLLQETMKPFVEESAFFNSEKAETPPEASVSLDPGKTETPMEDNDKPVAKRSHLPFNVIMLNQDRRKWEQKKQQQQSIGKDSAAMVAPQPVQQAPEPNMEKKETERTELHREEMLYQFPPLDLLHPPVYQPASSEWLLEQEQVLNQTLRNFNVGAQVVNVTQGPSVTRFEVQPDAGVKVNKITNLSDDIKLSLAARDIRIEAPIPGKHTIGIEVPNQTSRPVLITEILQSPEFQQSQSPLTVALGLDISGEPIVTDLRKMPHGLIAGATGSGKSVCINTMLVSLLYKANPDEVKLLLIDPKMVELAPYNQIPHLVSPVITDVKAATAALKWAVDEMERRYELFAHTGVRDISRFNELAEEHKRYSDKLPYIVLVIDELADLMMMSPADVEEAICRIAQKARACGIHLLIATQRPSVDVITGLIKANVPTRIAFSVSSQIDSRTIIDISGAEKLLGRGDMLFLENGASKPVRLQGTFVSDLEIDEAVAHVRKQREPEYLFEQAELLKKAQVHDEEDELFFEACEFVIEQGGASTSSLQRRFKIGYNRAARLIDLMEQQGFISEARGSRPRDVLITEDELGAIQETNMINH